MGSVYDWSLIAANNGNADSDINWAEGQAPSTVNNSARFMMQRVKEMLADLGATATTGGTANALTFSAKSAFASYFDGIRLTIKAAASNSGSVTLNVNSVGAKPVVKFTLSGEVSLAAGEIQGGGIYDVVYSTALNGAAGGWLLLNPTQQAIPTGGMVAYASDVVPSGWLEANGAEISRTTYAGLFSVIGTKWGAGNGSTTFNIPDTRGEFIRGWDHGRGADPGRAYATLQGSQNYAHTHGVTVGGAGAHTHTVRGINTAGAGSTGVVSGVYTGETGAASSVGDHVHTVTLAPDGGAESRPRNIAAMYLIKT